MDNLPLTPDDDEYMDFFSTKPNNNKNSEHTLLVEVDDTVCFNCQGEAQPSNLLFRVDSYQGKEYLHNLIILGSPGLYDVNEKIIFGKKTCLSQLHCKISHYFMIVKQNYNILEEQSSSAMILSNCNGNRPYEIRKDISNFFMQLSTLLKNLPISNHQQFRISVTANIFNLLRFINPFCSTVPFLTGISSPLGNKCTSPIHHHFHAQLDIRWWALCLLHQIDATSSEVQLIPGDVEPLVDEHSNDNSPLGAFESCASFVAWDIILLVHGQIMNTDVIENNKIARFPCTCVHELSSSLLHILDNRVKMFSQEQKDFWSLMKPKLFILMRMAELGSNITRMPIIAFYPLFPPDFGARISLKNIWCIFVELSKLYNWNAKGLVASDPVDTMKAEPKLVKSLLRISLKDGPNQMAEKELRFYLLSSLVLMDLWQKNITRKDEWVTLIWEFMVKHLNSSFFSGESTLEGFGNQRKSAECWFQQLNELDSDPNSTGKNDNSWHIFLKLIVGQLRWEGNWKVLQGRIYSKFHERKMLELNSNGIYNTISLFLIIGIHTDVAVLCTKLLELLSFVPNTAVGKLRIVFHGLFAIALTLISRSADLTIVAQCFEDRLSAVCKAIISRSSDRRELCALAVYYGETLCIILDRSSDFSLSQEKFFSPPLALVMGVVSSVEKASIFSAINCALKKIIDCSQVVHLLSDGRCLQLLIKLWTQFGAHVRYLPSMGDASRVSCVASSFFVCCVNMSSVADSEKNTLKNIASELLLRFVSIDSGCTQMAQSFIVDIVNDTTALNNTIRLFPNFEETLVRYSISALITYGESGDVAELFEVVFRLPTIATLVPDPSCHPFRAIEDLFIVLAQQFHLAKDSKARLAANERANCYFQPLENISINKGAVPLHFYQIMGFVGELFLHECQTYDENIVMFYTKGKSNCLLSSLINKLILPTSIYGADKPLVKAIADSYCLLLPKILVGFVNLNPSCDTYIHRCFRDVIIHYLYRFPPNEHPFLAFFENEKSHSMKAQFLEIVKDNYITKRKCPTPHLQIVFELLLRLLSLKQKEWLPLMCKHIFLNVLELLMVLLDGSNTNFITNFLKKLFLQDLYNNGKNRANIMEGIRLFVSSQLNWASTKVFATLMKICELDATLIANSMEVILEVVIQSEEKRGTGHNIALRKGLQALDSKCKSEKKLYTNTCKQ